MTINVERRGTGEPLVLIHGICHRWQAWEPIIDALAVHHDVIAIDLPGFGLSPIPDGGLPRDLPSVAASIAAHLDALGVSRPHIAGNSLGGAIGLELALAGGAASVTALSPAGFATRPQRWWALGVLAQLRASTFVPQPVLRRFVASPVRRTMAMGMIMARPRGLSAERAFGDALAMRRGKGFVPMARVLRRYRFEGSPDVPVTVAWGSRDRILVPRQADRARVRLPGARHVALPGCGHVPMGDDPELVASVILATTGAVTSTA